MPKPSDVVVVDFAGASLIKRRPAVVVSTDVYHAHRPDVVVAVLTSNTAAARSPTDYVLQDSSVAGLHLSTAFRAYFGMTLRSDARVIGRLSARDWRAVQDRLRLALAVT